MFLNILPRQIILIYKISTGCTLPTRSGSNSHLQSYHSTLISRGVGSRWPRSEAWCSPSVTKTSEKKKQKKTHKTPTSAQLKKTEGLLLSWFYDLQRTRNGEALCPSVWVCTYTHTLCDPQKCLLKVSQVSLHVQIHCLFSLSLQSFALLSVPSQR